MFALLGSVRLCRTEKPRNSCLVFHGWSMKSDEMSKEWGHALCEASPTTEFIFLQAPISYNAAGGSFETSWFKYLNEFDGEKEDEICPYALSNSIEALATTISQYTSNPVVLLGLSEGGCMALCVALQHEIGTQLKGVITVVSHKPSFIKRSATHIKWFALTANLDTVYPLIWTSRCYNEAISWHTVNDDHYLSQSTPDVCRFICQSLMACLDQSGAHENLLTKPES